MKRTILTVAMVLGCALSNQSFGFDLLDRMLGIECCASKTCCDTGCDVGCEPACGAEMAGCGCAEPACGCEAPACGCAVEPECGCAEPACGCEAPACGCAEPACGMDVCGGCEVATCDSGCCDSGCGLLKGCKGGLLSKLFGKKNSCGCDMGCAAPTCGCEVAACEPMCCDSGCDSGCGLLKSHKCGLLAKLFGKKRGCGCDSGCDMGCGCAAPTCGMEASGCGCGGSVTAPMAAPVMQSAPMPPAPVVDPSARVSQKRRVIQASASYRR